MTTFPRGLALLGLVGMAAGGVGAPAARAQVKLQSNATEITLTGRVQTQFNTTSVSEELASEFLLRRVRLTAEVEVGDFISGKVQPDFGEGDVNLKDAWLRLNFGRGLRLKFGQFKRPFDLFELTSSTKILVIERAGSIRGVSSCGGVGGICSLSRFTEALGYSDRDIGVMLDGQDRSRRLRYMVSVTNGAGANKAETNDGKTFTGRLEYSLRDGVRLAGNVSVHDFIDTVTSDSTAYATAYGADVEVGDYDGGWHLQAGVVGGDNWKRLDPTGDPRTYVTAQGILTHKSPVHGSRYLEAIEPLARVSWGNPDTNAADDQGWLITPGFALHLRGRNKIALNVDIWTPTQGDSELSFKAQSYLHF
ncbi:MAG: porin [Gemmatimonadota bacterium]